jgi:hypothetical protein
MRRQVTTIITVAGLMAVPASVAGAQPFSPDANDANVVAGQHSTYSSPDPRSPDARDAQAVLIVPPGVIAKATPTTPSARGGGNGFGWDDAGMGAGGLVLIAGLGLGTVYAIRHRRPRAPLAH